MPSHPSTGIGIVGAGFIAESHAQAAAGHPGLRVVAVHDLSPAAAAALAARHGARTHATLGDLLADPGVDAVILGTPNDTHTRLALQIAAAGKHLLLEKPLALSVDDAVEIAAAFRGSGLTLLVGHTHRHADYARTVHATLRAGVIGRVRSLRIAITAGWIWGNWGAWVLDPAHSGGHAFQNGVHLYDLACWWMGDRVDRVAALGQKLTSAALAIDDSLVTTLHFRGGGSAVCEISRGERPKGTALFEIVAHGTLGHLVRRWDSDGAVVFTEGFSGSVSAVGLSPFERQLAVWYDAINGAAPVTPDPTDAIHAVAVAVAAHRAAEQGDTIDVQETA